LNWKALREGARLSLLFAAFDAVGQSPGCELPPFSGASSTQGAVATMIVVNDGQPCGITLYGIPGELRNPATQGVITVAPKHGKAEFVGPRIQYTPAAGYVGDDEFSCAAWANDSKSRSVMLNVQMKVQVRATQ
jgi:hypothetical protein